MIDPQVAFDKLAGFQSSDEIAKYFEEQGITGTPVTVTSCPIAKWMSEITGIRYSVGTLNMEAIYRKDRNDRSNDFDLTSAMSSFIRRFDNGDYPNLMVFRR